MTKTRTTATTAAAFALGSAATAGLIFALGAGSAPQTEATAAAVRTATAASTAGLAAETATYTIDAVHSGVNFKLRRANASHFHGRFNELGGELTFNPAVPTASSVNIEIPIASVDTNNERRDQHLRAADFFNARQFPTATFVSTGVAPTDEDGVYELSGDFTFHGTTERISAELVHTGSGNARGNEVVGFEATFSIKRGDFGVTQYLADDGSDTGGLGNTVEITVWVEAIKQ